MALMLGMCYILCVVISKRCLYVPGVQVRSPLPGLFLACERCEANKGGSLYIFLVGFRN
jgi:hypothetical protein